MSAKFPRGGGEQTHSQPSVYLFCFNNTCNCVDVVSVTSASRYVTSATRYQNGSSMNIRGLIPQNLTELADAVLIDPSYPDPFRNPLLNHSSKIT